MVPHMPLFCNENDCVWVTKKIPNFVAGLSERKEKPAVRDLLTAGVSDRYEIDIHHKRGNKILKTEP